MGQAWCKEKTSKAEDSKSPLDRVFVRCAHRIYPSLKEEGSVLGSATQRVTSSEIGYAGSPPREVLTRGRSIDSVDRPFHPSEWVDVNLEVPSTPRPGSALTNLTVDTSLYPATTPTSSCSNLKDAAPVPPPRRKKRNQGRPLPPKPDEVAENAGSRRAETGDEPLYSSVRSPRSSGDEQDAEEEIRHDKHRDGRKTKEIYEHKVNGTGRIISSDMVSGKRSSHIEDKKTGCVPDQNHRKAHESDEYDRFASSRASKDSSTPNRDDKRWLMVPGSQIKDTSRDTGKSNGHTRTKNYSTVSLPNYDELDVARHQTKGTKGQEGDGERTKSRRPVRSSTGSLPAGSFLAPFSEKTSVRLEDYIPRPGSPEQLSAYQVLEKLDCGTGSVDEDSEVKFVKYDPSKSEDWELAAGIDDCESSDHQRISVEGSQRISNGDDFKENVGEDLVDFGRKYLTDREDAKVYIQKPESFGKTPSPAFGEPEYSEVDPNRAHLRYFDPPTIENSCRSSTACETSVSKEPFYLDEAKHRSALDTIGGRTEPDRSEETRMIFRRSLSNESEPEVNAYESKELADRPSSLIRTISEESLPREMLEQQEMEDFFDEKLVKDAHNKLRKNLDDQKTKTPPPSPEPRAKPEVLDADHSTLLKVLKDEAAEESNLSSMTPSLTELEAALSDMLEKEETQEVKDEGRMNNGVSQRQEGLVHDSRIDDAGTKSVDSEDSVQESTDQGPVSLGQILGSRKPVPSRKVSFCAWEETLEDQDDREFTERPQDLDKNTVSHRNEERRAADQPPEKPSRLNRNMEDLMEDETDVPTPPRRRHRSLGKKEEMQNGSVVAESYLNDRLI
nr:uncharacterized protein LOC116433123 [Nomia melanderi]XP_031846746.1 uncharacterized protein LOC116433123 [Nomia melanderi]XP_031846747.1 uncharacterized protein LOC116433123 [Nomia melanderi]